MMKNIRCTIFFCLLVQVALAQDPVFSQFYAAPIQLNPALTGITSAPRVSLNHRNQYPNWPNAYITYALSYEQQVEAFNSAFGFVMLTDAAGDGGYKINYVSAVYSYKVRIGEVLHAKFGMEAGIYQARIDWDRFQFGDQIDVLDGAVDAAGNPFPTQELRPDVLSTTLFDASAGVLFYGGPVYAGLSMKHLNRPNETFLELNQNLFAGRPLRLTIHAGGEFDLGRRNKRGQTAFISPNLMFVKQADTGQINAGAYVGSGRIYGGAWYRHNFTFADAAIFSVGVREGVFRIGYSYDMTVSELATAAGGTGNTHEIALTINLADSKLLRQRAHAQRWNDCFKMFR